MTTKPITPRPWLSTARSSTDPTSGNVPGTSLHAPLPRKEPMAPTELPMQAPPGLSTSEESLYLRLTEHVASEAEFISAYRERAEAADTPEAVRYVIRLVLEDEERHHRILHQILIAIGNGIAWRNDTDAVPDLPYKPDPELATVTRRFLAAERADRKELHALRKELRPFRDTNLWALLVDLMEHDTAKHIHMLRFLADHVA